MAAALAGSAEFIRTWSTKSDTIQDEVAWCQFRCLDCPGSHGRRFEDYLRTALLSPPMVAHIN